MMIRFIGDIHGHWKGYSKRIKDVDTSIQVGDFGIGFYKPYTDKLIGGNPPLDDMKKGDHRFIRGNHDNPHHCIQNSHWIPDGTLVHDKIFCIGGGLSIDKHLRTENYTWWPEEELTQLQFDSILEDYRELKPEVIVAHEMPESVVDTILGKWNMTKQDYPSITRQFLDILIEEHKPSLFVHGHWHRNHHTVLNGLEYIGLGELSTIDLDV